MGLLWAVYRACGATFPIDGFWSRTRVVLLFAEWLLPLAAVVHFLCILQQYVLRCLTRCSFDNSQAGR